jgi:hypothetical protein
MHVLNDVRPTEIETAELIVLNDVRPTEIETAELIVPKPSAFDVEIATKKQKNPVIDPIPEEIIKASIHLLILFRIRSNCLSSGKEMIIVPIDKKGDKRV